MKSIRALVLDDSAICRNRLRDMLECEGDIVVVGEAPSGERVLPLIERTHPNILLVDLQMPGMGGHETIAAVMANRPLPILVVTGQPEGVRKLAIFESIRRGALDLAEKPVGGDVAAQARLRSKVRQLSAIPVVRHIAGKLHRQDERVDTPLETARARAPGTTAPLVVGIGASAGGPLPLAALLAELPATFPAAVAVVQHLPVGFHHAFAEFLSARTRLEIVPVDRRTPIRRGCLYVPVDERHLVASDSTHLGATADAPLDGHRPSVDVLFESLARNFGSRAAGVILSGIGQDGVKGLLNMRRAGALTLAQDQASSAVFGMPRAAVESRAAEHALSPLDLARTLREWAASNAEKQAAP